MVIALGLAAGLVIGAPLPVLAGVGLALWQPAWLLAMLLVRSLMHIRGAGASTGEQEAVFLQALAAELRAGASLRHAVNLASMRSTGLRLGRVVRLAAAGRPLDQVAGALDQSLPRLGRLAASAVRTSAVTGGRVADVFDGLALVATEEVALVRERKAATAQARLSAWIVAGLPIAYVFYAGVTGRLGAVTESGPVGIGLLALGLALLTAGVAAIWMMVRVAER